MLHRLRCLSISRSHAYNASTNYGSGRAFVKVQNTLKKTMSSFGLHYNFKHLAGFKKVLYTNGTVILELYDTLRFSFEPRKGQSVR